VATSLLIVVVVLLLWAIYQIDLLRKRVERLHTKVNSIRRAIAPDELQSHVETPPLHSVETARVAHCD